MDPFKWQMYAQIPIGLAERLRTRTRVHVRERRARESDREGLCHTLVQDEDYE